MAKAWSPKTVGLVSLLVICALVGALTFKVWYSVSDVDEDEEDDKDAALKVSSHMVLFETGAGSFISMVPKHELLSSAEVKIVLSDADIVKTISSFTVKAFSKHKIFIPLHSKHVAGHCVISFKSKSPELKNLFKVRVNVRVVHNILFGYMSVVVGWLYFLSWSLSYYPQCYKNFKRKSVKGYSFDYMVINYIGQFCYCVFNSSMYWNHSVQKQYMSLHPKGDIPVKANDVTFSFHSVAMTTTMAIQCMIYESGGQRVSLPNGLLCSSLLLAMVSGLAASIKGQITWLQYIYCLCFIKLGTVPLKYLPQVYLHYINKSTDGWAIKSVWLDFSGGVLSFLQMVIDTLNNDAWDNTFGNPVKLGLGFISIVFNLIFMMQHYILYASSPKLHVRKPSGSSLDSKSSLGKEPKKKIKMLPLIGCDYSRRNNGKVYNV